MKLTPSSTARRKTFFAFSRSGGQPQIPSPVSRIAPNPSRLTDRSPPNKNVSSLLLALPAAAKNFGSPPVRTPAAPAEIVPKNVRRVTSLCIEFPFLLHKAMVHEFSDQMLNSLLSLPVLVAVATVVGEVFRSLDATPFRTPFCILSR